MIEVGIQIQVAQRPRPPLNPLHLVSKLVGLLGIMTFLKTEAITSKAEPETFEITCSISR